jgi:hypothetical protein
MSKTINGSFETRRDADMAVERLVQEFGVERTDIFVAAQGQDNSVGPARAGSDSESDAPSPEAREDGAHEGAIVVSVDVNDDEIVSKVAGAIREFSGTAERED